MASYPYSPSGQGALVQTFDQLQNNFPAKVDAGYLQRFNIAPTNESYIISILRFLGLIDGEGNRIESNTSFFFGNDEAFKAGLDKAFRDAYKKLLGEMGDSALTASKEKLTHWFRSEDKTSALVGQRQASTFQTIAALAGHSELPSSRGAATPRKSSTPNKKTTQSKTASSTSSNPKASGSDQTKVEVPTPQVNGVGLTVRIEVNLPAGGDAPTYDAIFASIKKHLMS